VVLKRGTVKVLTSNAQITISSDTNGVRTVARGASEQWTSSGRPDWLIIPTYERCFIQRVAWNKTDANPHATAVVVKPSSPAMLEMGCDRCGGPHSTRNIHCSANLNIMSPFISKRPGIYDIHTGVLLTPAPVIIERMYKPRSALYKIRVYLSQSLNDRYQTDATMASSR